MGDRPVYEPIRLKQIFLLHWLSRIKGLLKRVGLLLLATCVAGLLAVLYLKSRPLPPPEIPLTAKIYDVHGQLIATLDRGEHREPVTLQEVPPHLKAATIAAEDHTFYSHWGFSPKGILRAAWVNLRRGKLAQGASTITQQLARNLYLTHDRTWSRKWKETVLATQLELHFSKDEILEMYLNQIYYGHGAYGIQRAARVYFGKSPKELNLAESALLAGIIRGPKWYSPFHQPDRAKKRQHEVLTQMVQMGAISKEEAIQATQTPILFKDPPLPESTKAPYFRDYIIREALQLGIDESQLYHEGLKIYTTLDLNMQRSAEKAVHHYLSTKNELQGALVAMEPKTGAIRAMVGGKNYQESQYNRIFAQRQPGSSFKPILYLAALQQGFTPLTQLESKPTTFTLGKQEYTPSNYGDRYANRPITLRESIAWSDNIYAVATHLRIGREQALRTARQLGIQSPLRAVPSLALGTETVTPFELTRSYATLAAGGKRPKPFGILRIEAPDGTLVTQTQIEAEQAVPQAHAYVLTNLLQGVFEPGGTAHRVKQIFPAPAAGKTGTTEWDGWLAGYTPNLATTVWIGYDRGKKLTSGDSRLAQYIWATFMRDALQNDSEAFPTPSGVVQVMVDSQTGQLATERCSQVYEEVFVQGTEPVETCTLHSTPSSHQAPSLWEWLKKWWSKESENP